MCFFALGGFVVATANSSSSTRSNKRSVRSKTRPVSIGEVLRTTSNSARKDAALEGSERLCGRVCLFVWRRYGCMTNETEACDYLHDTTKNNTCAHENFAPKMQVVKDQKEIVYPCLVSQ